MSDVIPGLITYQTEYPALEYGTIEDRWGELGYLICESCDFSITSHSGAGMRGICPWCDSIVHWRLFNIK